MGPALTTSGQLHDLIGLDVLAKHVLLVDLGQRAWLDSVSIRTGGGGESSKIPRMTRVDRSRGVVAWGLGLNRRGLASEGAPIARGQPIARTPAPRTDRAVGSIVTPLVWLRGSGRFPVRGLSRSPCEFLKYPPEVRMK